MVLFSSLPGGKFFVLLTLISRTNEYLFLSNIWKYKFFHPLKAINADCVHIYMYTRVWNLDFKSIVYTMYTYVYMWHRITSPSFLLYLSYIFAHRNGLQSNLICFTYIWPFIAMNRTSSILNEKKRDLYEYLAYTQRN